LIEAAEHTGVIEEIRIAIANMAEHHEVGSPKYEGCQWLLLCNIIYEFSELITAWTVGARQTL
jgi:hypothetical protein